DVKGTLDHDALKGAGLARGGKDGVRLLGKGELKAKIAFKVAGVSKGAREAVEKAGGSIELIERKNPAELAAAKKGKTREARLAGIDPAAMAELYKTQSGGILDVFNTFSGGALSRFSIVALGVMPYITASIVVQIGATVYGPWQALRKEGETGRKKLNQYTRYLTLMITLVQGYLAVRGLE